MYIVVDTWNIVFWGSREAPASYALLFRYDDLLLEDDVPIIVLPGTVLRWAGGDRSSYKIGERLNF